MWLQGDVLDRLAEIPDESVQCVVTSPPYWGLRDYGVDGQIGLEPTLQEWLDKMVDVFREVRRVLRPDGTVWLNIGDAYSNGGRRDEGFNKRYHGKHYLTNKQGDADRMRPRRKTPNGLKPKDCLMMDYRLALALQADGWWVRSKIVWAKPNCMPESATDRPTSSHEMIFLLSKSVRYYYDGDAIREEKAPATVSDPRTNDNGHRRDRQYPGNADSGGTNLGGPEGGRNSRNVWMSSTELVEIGVREQNDDPTDIWTIATHARPEAHFATFPPELVRRCIAAGTSEKGSCPKCGKPWARVTEPSAEYASRRENYRVMRFDGEGIGNYISDGLNAKGMSQSELASHFPSKTGGKTGCVHNWVTGKNIPTGKQWQVIKKVLDLNSRYDLLLENPATSNSISYGLSDMVDALTKGKNWSSSTPGYTPETKTLGWQPGCTCTNKHGRYESTPEPVPCIVLDIFAGIGTTLAVAARMGRASIGIELNPEYIEMGLPDCEAAFKGITVREVEAGQEILFGGESK